MTLTNDDCLDIQDPSPWLVTFSPDLKMSGVDPVFTRLHTDCLVLTNKDDPSLWRVAGFSRQRLLNLFRAFNVTQILPTEVYSRPSRVACRRRWWGLALHRPSKTEALFGAPFLHCLEPCRYQTRYLTPTGTCLLSAIPRCFLEWHLLVRILCTHACMVAHSLFLYNG